MYKKIVLIALLFLGLQSCSPTKNIAEGELLYTGAKVTIEGQMTKKEKKALTALLSPLIRPIPNQKFLGSYPKLSIYNWAGIPKKEKGIRHWMRTKAGEAPVLGSRLDPEYNRLVLQNFLENNGYFNAKTKVDTLIKGKTIQAIYTISPSKAFKIKNVFFPNDSSELSKAIQSTAKRSLLKIGAIYTLETIKEERIRIDERIKEKGFYYFSPEYLKIQVDTTIGDATVDLIIKVKDEAPSKAKSIYKINNIVVHTNYSVGKDTLITTQIAPPNYKDFNIIDPDSLFKPIIFDRSLFFKKEEVYNRSNQNLSLNRLVNLGTFKMVRNEFKPSLKEGNYLDAYYYLSPNEKKSLRFELLAKSNSANYQGTELNANWSHRNTFRGAELLTVSVFGGFEIQVSGQNKGFNVYRVGSEANLIWPRMIAPIRFKMTDRFTPTTKATIGYEYQERQQLYTLQTFKALFGYNWKENARREHTLNLGEVIFARPRNVTQLYLDEIENNPSLKKVIERQLIFGPTYSFTYSNTAQKRKKNTLYYKGTIDVSAALTGIIAGANIDKKDTLKIFSVPFSQYIKLENEFRHYLKIRKESQLASRIIVGTALPFGNSKEMPFIKQFFIGGTNSIRAFRARSIGPGSSIDPALNTEGFLADQSGDIKIELNTEFRTTLFSFVKGAAFIDAGNIWLLNENKDKPGAKFSKNFMKEMAVGAGLGLRFDFNFLVLRTDFAFPLRKPYLPEGKRWVIDQINLGNGAWRKENLIFNLAIGYPF
ncbi:BamA/TamA family outer membrane protein [Flavobacterium sp. TSSA_36]|uniref:translocation and assembly module lipoprotein TamL n=1 Tax=Flavobacterium sp. TSSA_36 TaxID=3447669 RepID=UPI003F38109F